MKKAVLSLLFAAATMAAMAATSVVKVATPITDLATFGEGGEYMLHNVGRNRWIAEDGYAALTFQADFEPATDRSLDYVFKISRTPEGLYTFQTRRGRFIPEVDESTPATVGHADRAGKFVISCVGNNCFTITNSQDTRYGFDGTASAFVGWDAAQGNNCRYEIVPVEFGPANYPLGEYAEPDDEESADPAAWLRLDSDLPYFTWASRDVQYRRHEVPQVRLTSDTTITAWRGERVGVQALAFARKATPEMKVELITNGGPTGTAAWTRYVLTDENRTCGDHNPLPTWTVPDVIDRPGSVASVENNGVRPVWCTFEVPRDLPAGQYSAILKFCRADNGEVLDSLNLKVNVVDQTLPEVADQKFYLDFWQQPYSVSRYYGLERWSDEHFDALRPYMQALARAGQKVVTAILFHEPWGQQSYDKFDPMVETVLTTDGTWKFDYTIFDKWVEFMDACGINARINCYSMVPWDMSFRYLDEATDTYKYLKVQTSADEYSALWTAFLTDFAAHLKEKGWFEKTAIGMDERGLAAMRDAITIVNSAAPGLKIALAGNYHSEISADLYDYSIAYAQKFPADELARRKEAGQISTVYICCSDPGANIFTNNAPSDAAYLPLQAVACGVDGLLHWSWLNWNETPLLDSRLQLPGSAKYKFAPGDTYAYYPGNRSSVRFERLIEGVQQAEKVRILKELWQKEGNSEKLYRLNDALAPFVSGKTDAVNNSAIMVNNLESVVNGFDVPISDSSSLQPVSAATNRSSWRGNILNIPHAANVAIYAINGVLLHSCCNITEYDLCGYTPGNYIVTVLYSDGQRDVYNRLL